QLEEGSASEDFDEDEQDDACDFEADNADEDEEDADEQEVQPPARRRSRRGSTAPSEKTRGWREEVRTYLERLPTADLVAYVMEPAGQDTEIRRELRARSKLARGEAGELIREAGREIRRLTHEPAWVNEWTGEGSLPDFTGLKRLFERLLAMGQADALLGLGENLLESGTEQVGSSHDEGELGTEIGECLEVVFRAVFVSSRP